MAIETVSRGGGTKRVVCGKTSVRAGVAGVSGEGVEWSGRREGEMRMDGEELGVKRSGGD